MSDYLTKVPQTKEEAILFVGELRRDLAARDTLLRKVGVCTYIRNKIENYEMVLSNFQPNVRLQNLNSAPPNLDTLNLNLYDETVKQSYFTHYNRWMNILNHSQDPRMPAIRNVLHSLQFSSHQVFSRYIAILFVHVSNIIHNMPPDILEWENEDVVIQALQQWHVTDLFELRACRCIYRLPLTT